MHELPTECAPTHQVGTLMQFAETAAKIHGHFRLALKHKDPAALYPGSAYFSPLKWLNIDGQSQIESEHMTQLSLIEKTLEFDRLAKSGSREEMSSFQVN